jgi:hypothetical protein
MTQTITHLPLFSSKTLSWVPTKYKRERGRRRRALKLLVPYALFYISRCAASETRAL